MAHGMVAHLVQACRLEIDQQHGGKGGGVLGHDLAGWGDGQGISRKFEAVAIFTHLVASDNVDAVVKGPGRQVPQP